MTSGHCRADWAKARDYKLEITCRLHVVAGFSPRSAHLFSSTVGPSGLPLKEGADSINHALRLPIR